LPAAIEQNLPIVGQQKHSLPGVRRDAARLKNTGGIEGQGEQVLRVHILDTTLTRGVVKRADFGNFREFRKGESSMTEQEWLSCTDPDLMLNFLRGKVSDRKLRLLTVSSGRRVWGLLNEPSRRAIEIGERYADGSAGKKELTNARSAVRACDDTHIAWHSVREAIWTSAKQAMQISAWRATATKIGIGKHIGWMMGDYTGERTKQTNLLRDIFGNPFRSVTLHPAVLAWNDGTITKLAQAIYDDRAFDHLPILADALEEAGCTNTDILNHCRQPGEHVRGCWVVDLLLGKKLMQ
jgi:hypothetical protein